MQKQIRWQIAISVVACVIGLFPDRLVEGSPSPATVALLETRLPPVSQSDRSLSAAVGWLLSPLRLKEAGVQCNLNVGIERDESKSNPRITADIPEAPLSEQLTKVLDKTGYVYAANGGHINFIPKSKVDDPNYVFNLKLPGNIIVSKDLKKDTPIKQWLQDHKIEVVRIPTGKFRSTDESRDLRIATGAVDPIVLDSPTLREYCNAHEALYGLNTWIATVQQIPLERRPGGGVLISISGQPTYIIGGAK